MNILVIPSWYENKNNKTHGSFFREQAKALSELGHNIYMLYVDIIRFNEVDRIITTKKYDFYEDEGMKVYRKKVVKIPKTSEVIVANKVRYGIEDLYNKYIKNSVKIDVIHAHSFIWGGYAGVNISKKFNIPIMVTEHYSGYGRNLFTEEEKKLISYSMNNCDEIVAVSRGLKDKMNKFTNREIKVIPNMVEERKIIPIDNGSKKEVFEFLCVAYLREVKGIDILLKAFSEAIKVEPQISLKIGGDGPDRKFLEELSKKLGISDKVKFLGALDREEVFKHMNSCDCFVMTSRHETFGVVYIEALSQGKPVIATNNDATQDIINKNNGIVVRKDNIEDTRDALLYIKDNYNNYDSYNIIKECYFRFGKNRISKVIEKNLLTLINYEKGLIK